MPLGRRKTYVTNFLYSIIVIIIARLLEIESISLDVVIPENVYNKHQEWRKQCVLKIITATDDVNSACSY